MRTVVYEEHVKILNELLSTARTRSVEAGAETGPFQDIRSAYVFAASLGLALGEPTPKSEMPENKKQGREIADHTFFGTRGAKEVSLVAALVVDLDIDDVKSELRRRLELIGDGGLGDRLAILDRYAHAGFKWLDSHRDDEDSVRSLIFRAISEIQPALWSRPEFAGLEDPFLRLIGGAES